MKKLIAFAALSAALICCAPAPAAAQNPICATMPVGDSTNACASTAFVQNQLATGLPLAHTHIFVGNGSNLATDFGALVTFADTGGLTLAPSSGGALTVTGPSGLARALDVTQTVTGTDTVTHQINNFAITDSADLGANVGNGLNIAYSYGGSTAKGSRQALQAGVTLTAPTNSANTKHFYAAAQFGAAANTGDNGTNTGAGAKGSIIALNPDCTLNSGATNLAECSGIQITMHSLAGSSVSQRSGLQIADLSGAGGVQGATFDDAIVIGSTASSPGFKIGLALDCTNFAGCPLATTGTAIKVVGAQTMDTFIDASSATVTTFINGPSGNFVVDNSGATQIKSTSAFGWVGSFSRILSPGDGVILLQDHLNATFGRLQLGGTTASFPAIKRNAAAINFRLADDSADAAITVGATTLSAALTYGGVTLSNAVTGTGNMVLATSPTLTTPTLGVAAATSVAVDGCTIGANFLCVGASTPMTVSAAGLVTIPNTTASTNPTVGAMVVTGGVGITGQLSVGSGGFQLYNATPAAVGFMGTVNAWTGGGSTTDFAFAANGTNFKIFSGNSTSSSMTITNPDVTVDKGNLIMGTAAKALVLKQGANGTVGTFVCNGVTPVTISNTNVAISDAIIISLNTVGGTVGAAPDLKTITAGTGFTAACTAADTSTYNYAIIKNAAWLLDRDLNPAANDNRPAFIGSIAA